MRSSLAYVLPALLVACIEGLRLKEECSTIPDNLHFNYKTVLFTDKDAQADDSHPFSAKEERLLENIKNTVQVFREKKPETKVMYADDAQCRQLIEEAHGPQLLAAFDREKIGMFKSDICRLAQLYIHGGHYFDNDLEVVKVPNSYFEKCTSFASVLGQSQNIFQAYLAAAPGHPLIKLAMDRLL